MDTPLPQPLSTNLLQINHSIEIPNNPIDIEFQSTRNNVSITCCLDPPDQNASLVVHVTGPLHSGCMAHFETTGFGNGRPSSVSSLVANLPELLNTMRHDPRTLIAIADFSDFRYIQFWAHSDGTVIGEVISNLNIGENVALRPDEEEQLRELGFFEPAIGSNPNWWTRVDPDASLEGLIQRMANAVYGVLREVPANSVIVSTWESDVPRNETPDQSRGLRRKYINDALKEAFKNLKSEAS